MADLKLVGAVAIKVRPDAKGFRRDADKQVKKQLAGADATIDLKADVNTKGVKAKVEKAKKEAEAKEIELRVGIDYASVQRAKAQVEKLTRSLDDKTIKFKLDKAGLKAAAAEIAGMEKNARVIIRYANDTRGWNDVLARLQEIQREKLVKEISFATDKASLESQIAYAKTRIRNLGIDLHYTNDRASIQRAIDDLNRRIEDLNVATIHTKLDEASLRATEAELRAKLDDTPATIKVDYDDQGSLKRVRAELDAMLSDLRSVNLDVDVSEDGIRRVRERIEDLIHDEDGQSIDLDVGTTGTAAVSAHLAYISRPRNVPFYATINAKSVAVVQGLLRSLAGVNAIQRTGNFLENLITNFDKISISSAGWMTAIGGLTNSLIYMTGSLFSIAGGLAQMVGLAALGPTAFGALASVMIVMTSVFSRFGDAVAGDNKALQMLPESGQKAAKAVGALWMAMREDTTKKFWDVAADGMLRFTNHALPVFTKGLVATASGMGRVFSSILDSFSNLAIAGGLERMYKNLDTFFVEGAKGATALWDALNTLGLQGTDLLPRFGIWVKDISIQFNNWIQAAASAGDITRWILNGIRSLQSLWSVAGSTIGVFQALTRAFDKAGHSGLGGFANTMERISDIMNGEPFQSEISNIFKGAYQGASELNVGVKDLGRAFMNSDKFVRELLTSLGKLGGGLLSNIATTFSNLRFQGGVMDGLHGMEKALQILNIGFNNLGSVIGNLGTIAGSIFKGIAPIMNSLVEGLDRSLGLISDNLVKLVPQMMNLFGGLLLNAQGPIALVVGGLNLVLTVLNALPDSVSGFVIALVGMLALRRQFAAFFTAINAGWARMNAVAGNGAATNGWMRNIRNVWAGTVTDINAASRRVDATPASRMFGRVATSIGIAARGIGASVRSAFSALAGGWIGLAVIAIGVAFAVIGQNAAAAKAQIDELQSSLDAAGQVTDVTIQANVKTLNDSKINPFTDNWSTKSATETIKMMGKSIEETAAIATKGGKAYDDMMNVLRSGKQAVLDASDTQSGYGRTLAKNKNAVQEWMDANNIAGNAADYTAEQFEVLIRETEKIAGATDKATTAWSNMNDALVQTSQRAEDFDAAMRKARDTTADMPARIQAFKDAVDVLNGKVRSTEEIQKAYNGSVRDMSSLLEGNSSRLEQAARDHATLNGVVDEGAIAADAAARKQEFWNGVIDKTTGAINTVSQEGADLDTQLGNLTSQTYGIVMDMQQKGAKPEEITAALEKAKQAWINQATQAGISAEAAGAAWDKMIGGSAKELTLLVTTPGMEDANSKLESFKTLLAQLDATRVIAEILGDDKDLAMKVITSSNDLAAFDKIVATATADLDPTKADAVRSQLINELGILAKTDPTVKAYMDPKIFEDERARILARIADLNRAKATTEVSAEISQAMSDLNTVNSYLNSLNGKTAHTYVNNRTVNSIEEIRTYQDFVKVPGGKYAKGGFHGIPGLRRFADGGFNEPKLERPGSAKIYAPLSNSRIFAESVTGGEAYIPMSQAKRPRSLAILTEVARRFGKTITDANQYATGAIAGAHAPTSSSSVDAQVHIGTINTVDPEGAIRTFNQKRRDALAVANIRG